MWGKLFKLVAANLPTIIKYAKKGKAWYDERKAKKAIEAERIRRLETEFGDPVDDTEKED